MGVRDHASLVTHRNCNLASTIVINSSQRRTCATMLALTSHYMATNAKHPRHAPGLSALLATQRNRQGGYWLREKVCRELGGCAQFARGFRSGSGSDSGLRGGLRGVGAARSETGDSLRRNALDPGFHGAPGTSKGEGERGRGAAAGASWGWRVRDNVEERWGLGAGRDIRRVRRWRGPRWP
jgi:hypothetical protein